MKLFIIIIIIILFTGCTQSNFDFGSYNSKIVVDGWIEQDQNAHVFLTLSAPYAGQIDSVSILNYALTRAKVTITDGNNTEILSMVKNTNYFPPYFYRTLRIKGQVGHTYTLTVDYGGITAWATTTIPPIPIVDSAWFKKIYYTDTLGFVYFIINDNAQTHDFYRTMTRVKNTDAMYIPTYISNYDDVFFNGQKPEFVLYKGSNIGTNTMQNIHYHVGDTIMLKVCSVDVDAYNFWSSLNRELLNTGNPFASTNLKVQSNINNGLGIWCGYGATYKLVIAK